MTAAFYGNLLPDGSAFKKEIVQTLNVLDGAALEGMQQLAYADVLRLFTKNDAARLAEIPGIRERIPAEGDLADECLRALLKVIEEKARRGC